MGPTPISGMPPSTGAHHPGGPSQMGSPQPGRPVMGAPQVGAPPIGPHQQSGGSTGLLQGGVPPMGIPQVGVSPMGPPQCGPPPVGPPRSNGPPRIGLPQSSGPSQMGLPSVGGLTSGPPSMGATPSGPPMENPAGPHFRNAALSGPPTSDEGPSSGKSPNGPSGSMPLNASSMGAHSGPESIPPRPPMQQGPPNPMIPPMTGPPQGLPQGPPTQNGVQNRPNTAVQPPSLGGYHSTQHQQGYNMSSPISPPGRIHPPNQPPQIGQGFVQAPPSMYGQPNGQYPSQAIQQQPYPGPPQQSAGYPGPPPGNYPQGSYPGTQQRPGMQSPQQQRKLDPEQMPSPVQVIQDDRKNNAGPFGTSKLGQLPPLVTTDVEVQDEGNAAPNYIRSTVYNVPCSPDITKQTQVPLALAITPFARHPRTDVSRTVTTLQNLSSLFLVLCYL